ncbi:MAG TPA: TatD family hydrolase [Stellaceae bacterium]|nr:TatD family hydrolase [Stellaceae bacterium]
MSRPLLVDSHCHLDYPELAQDRAGVIARARNAGIGSMVTICTQLSEFDGVRAIAESDPDIWCTVGTHPHEAAKKPGTLVETLVAHAAHDKVIAIGECGLDYHYDFSPRDVQAAVFRTHIEAAKQAKVPVVIHTREADEDTAAILGEACADGNLSGVLHCFTSGHALAMRGIELGFYVSFSGIITFKNAEDLRQIVRDVPLDRLLVETDAPFLAPVPKRGKPNEPAFVVHTAEAVAKIKGISVEELAAVTTANFHRLFGKARPAGQHA